MFDLAKKGMLVGLGLALKTWDEVEELVKDLQKKGEMSESEGRKFLDEARARYQETQDSLEKYVENAVKAFLKKQNIVTTDELQELRREVEELKKSLDRKD